MAAGSTESVKSIPPYEQSITERNTCVHGYSVQTCVHVFMQVVY